MQEIELPDGSIVEFPDGMSDADIANAIAQNFPQSASRTWGDYFSDVGRNAAIGTRRAIEAVDPSGPWAEYVNVALPYARKAANWIDGGERDTETQENFRSISTGLMDAAGVPKPENPSERLGGNISANVASTLATMGIGTAMQAGRGALQTAPTVLRGLGEVLAAAPKTQIASAMGSGAALTAAQERGAGPAGQLAASLAGGALPNAAAAGAVGVGRALAGGRTALDAFTGPGRNRIAGQVLNRNAANREAALTALENPEMHVPGSFPTTAQSAGDRGLAVLEKGLASSGPEGSAIQTRYLEQEAARQRAMQQELHARAPYAGALSVDEAGMRVRNAYDNNYGAAKQRTRNSYNSVDPDGSARFSLKPLVDDFQAFIGHGRYQEVPGPVQSLMGKMRTDINNGEAVRYKDLQDMRTLLTDMEQTAALTGDAPTKRMADGLKSRLDYYLEEGAQSPELYGLRSTPAEGTPLYKEATRIARESIENDPYYDDLAYLMKEGVNLDSAQQIIGAEGVRNLNSSAPGLIRKTGKLQADVIASDLNGAAAYGYGDAYTPSSGQALLDTLVDRLGPGRGRMRADIARRRDEVLTGMVEPHTGFAPNQVEAFQAAKQARREQGKRFEAGANQAMSRRGNSIEGQKVPTSLVAQNYFRAGQLGADGMRAFNLAAGNNADARLAMQDYAVSRALGHASRSDGTINLEKLTQWTKNHNPALRQLQMGDLSSLPDVRLDLNRARNAESLAAVRGSPTAQNLATQGIIDSIIGDHRITADTGAMGSVWRSLLTGIPRFASEKTGNFFFGPANDAVKDILIGASLDPSLARTLMSNSGYRPKLPISDVYGGLAKGYGASTVPTSANVLRGLLSPEYWQE